MSNTQLNDAMVDIVENGYSSNVEGIYLLPDNINMPTPEKYRVYSAKAALIDFFWQYNDRDALISKLHSMAEQIAGKKLQNKIRILFLGL